MCNSIILLSLSPSLASFISTHGVSQLFCPLLSLGCSRRLLPEHDARPIDEWACYNENGAFNDDNSQEYHDQEEEEAAAKRKFIYLPLMDMTEMAPSSIEYELPVDTIGGPPLKITKCPGIYGPNDCSYFSNGITL